MEKAIRTVRDETGREEMKVLTSPGCSGQGKVLQCSEEELWQCPGTASPWQRKIRENTPGAPPAPAGKAAGWKERAALQDAAPRGTQGDFGSSREKDVHEAQAGPEEILTNKF